jgi:hypothetical protein
MKVLKGGRKDCQRWELDKEGFGRGVKHNHLATDRLFIRLTPGGKGNVSTGYIS